MTDTELIEEMRDIAPKHEEGEVWLLCLGRYEVNLIRDLCDRMEAAVAGLVDINGRLVFLVKQRDCLAKSLHSADRQVRDLYSRLEAADARTVGLEAEIVFLREQAARWRH